MRRTDLHIDRAKSARHATPIGLLFLACNATQAATITVNDLGDSGPGDCSLSCTLRDAIAKAAQGDIIVFAPDTPPPWVITLNGNELFIYKSLSVIGPGPDQLLIDGHHESRLIEVALDAEVALSGIRFSNGSVTGTTAPPGSNAGGSVFGGAFFINPGTTLTLDQAVVENNFAKGGGGGQIDVSGNQAGNGGNATGGAFYNAGRLKISRASVVSNSAIGGAGGLVQSFSSQPVVTGSGGNADGGAIAGPGQLELVNVVFASNVSLGGAGGSIFALAPNRETGNGGNGTAGAIDAAGVSVLQFVSMNQNIAAGGAPGTNPFYPSSGQPGTSAAADILSRSTVLSRSSIIASDGGSCASNGGSFIAQGINVNADGTCPGFTIAANPIKPAVPGLNGYWVSFPFYGSVVIDAAVDCNDAFGNQLATDIEGVMRPQGTKCDVGAVESDYVFADGFED